MDFGLRLRKPGRDRPRITWKEVVEDINDLHLHRKSTDAVDCSRQCLQGIGVTVIVIVMSRAACEPVRAPGL